MSFSDMLGFFNEPIPSFFFEVLFFPDKFDPTDPFAMTTAMADQYKHWILELIPSSQ